MGIGAGRACLPGCHLLREHRSEGVLAEISSFTRDDSASQAGVRTWLPGSASPGPKPKLCVIIGVF